MATAYLTLPEDGSLYFNYLATFPLNRQLEIDLSEKEGTGGSDLCFTVVKTQAGAMGGGDDRWIGVPTPVLWTTISSPKPRSEIHPPPPPTLMLSDPSTLTLSKVVISRVISAVVNLVLRHAAPGVERLRTLPSATE